MRTFFLLFSLSFSLLYSDAWSPTPPQQIPSSAMSGKQVVSSYGSTLNEFFAAWTEGNLPTYATYNGSWSAPALIPGAGSSQNVITSSFVPTSTTTGIFLVTWLEDTTSGGQPTSAEFDGTNWGPIVSFGTLSATPVFTAYGSVPGVFMATWVDQASNGTPFFAIFNGSWSAPSAITTALAGGLVFPSYDSNSNIFLALWQDTSGNPIFATYNGAWTTPTEIPGSSPSTNVIFSAFDNNSNIFLATWQDEATLKPFYATYNYATDTWSTPGPIDNAQGNFATICSFDPVNAKFLAAWQDQSLNIHYGIYDYPSNTWRRPVTKPPATIPGSGMTSSPEVAIFNSCDTATGRFLLGWQDASHFPFYDTYSLTAPAPTTTTVTSEPNPSKIRERVNFRAKVTSPSLSTPTGKVTFKGGGKVLGTALLDSNGVAKLTTCALNHGTFTITAIYQGNANFLGSVGTTTQKVK